MCRSSFLLSLCAALLAVLTPSLSAQQAVELRLKWPLGNRYVYQVDMIQDSEISLPGQPQPMKQATTIGQQFALSVLKERPTGGQEVEMEFLSMEMEMKMGGASMLKVSTKEPPATAENPAGAIFRKMVGSKFKSLTNAQGQVEKIEGMAEFLTKVGGGEPGMGDMMKSMFSEEQMKQMLQAVQLPAKPVRVGETWTSRMNVPMGEMGTMVVDSTYTFTGMEQHEGRNCAVLDQKGTLTSEGGAGKGPGGASVSMGDSTMTATNYFDPALGALITTKANQKMNMKIAMPNPTDPKVQIETGMTMNQQISMRLVELGKVAK